MSNGCNDWHTLGKVKGSLVGSVGNCLVELGNLRRPQIQTVGGLYESGPQLLDA